MKLILTLIVMLLVFGSCGKKSDPKYKASINNSIIII